MRHADIMIVLVALHTAVQQGRLQFEPGILDDKARATWLGMSVTIGEHASGSVELVLSNLSTPSVPQNLILVASHMPSDLGEVLLRIWVEVNPSTAKAGAFAAKVA